MRVKTRRHNLDALRRDTRRTPSIASRRSPPREPSTRTPRCDTAMRVLELDGPFDGVVNDRRDLYPEILRRAGLRLDDRLERHVNRRTGRRAGEYFESVLVCRAR